MKKILVICFIMAILCSILPIGNAEQLVDASVTNGCNTVDAMVPFLGVQQSVKNNKAAVLYETHSDTLMYASNADEKLPPSSLLKILTALIAIEKGNLTDIVMVKQEVLDTLDEDAAVVKLTADEVVTVQDLLYCMLVGSGNDAAVVLADHIMGSQQAFVEEMNRYALELGCTGTNFTNVHGLHDDAQYTTARDVVKILRKAMQNETFSKAFGAKYYSVPETNKSAERHLATQNYLMNNDKVIAYFDERVVGGRTAVANDRTRSVASVARVNDMELICVVMGAESVYEEDGYSVKVFGGYNETKQLFDMGFTGYKTAQILHTNQVIQQKSVLDGNSDLSIGTNADIYSVVPENITQEQLVFRYVDEIPLSAPIKRGQKISTLQIWLGLVCIAQTDVFAMNSVVPANAAFDNNITGRGDISIFVVLLWILGGLCGVVLIGFGALSALRAMRIAKIRQKRRRNRANRRRSR